MHTNQARQATLRWLRRYKVWLEFAGLAVLIMLPLLLPGYILAFDMAWGPVRPLPSPDSNNWLLQTLLSGLGYILPAWLVQKLVLLVIFTLGGVGAYRLPRFIKGTKSFPPALYAAGFLYVCNPFVYTRFVTGQWLVLAGWALLPWAVTAVWRLARRPSLRSAAPAAIWLAAIALVSIHTAAMLVVVVPVLLLAAGKRNWRPRVQWSIVAILAALVINIRWLLPVFNGNSSLGDRVAGFGGDQLSAFASLGSILNNVPLSTFLLQGFWADGQQRYTLPSAGGWPWGIAVCLLIGLLVAGTVRMCRNRDRLGIALLGLGLLAWLLAMGSGWPVTAPLAGWLADNLPFYAGFREPHKWLMLLALLFSYAFGHALLLLRNRLGGTMRSLRHPAIGLALLIPFVFAGIMLFGASRQLQTAQYPNGWAETKTLVDSRDDGSPIVVLPWHMYLPIGFAGRTVANPAGHYFKGPVITGNDPELRGLQPDDSDALTNGVAGFALRRDPRGLQAMREADRQYIVVIKEADWQRYAWLDKISSLRKIQSTDSTIVYRIDSNGS